MSRPEAGIRERYPQGADHARSEGLRGSPARNDADPRGLGAQTLRRNESARGPKTGRLLARLRRRGRRITARLTLVLREGLTRRSGGEAAGPERARGYGDS